MIHHGIKGPVNFEYVDGTLIHTMLNGIKLAQYQTCDGKYQSPQLYQGLRIWTQTLSEEESLYQINIEAIPGKLLFGNDEYSLRSCIEKFIEAQASNDFSKIFSYPSFHPDVSKECYNDLSKHGLVSKYHGWEPKKNGYMDGLILQGHTKTGLTKKIFVKQFYLQESLDFAVLSIAKTCGVRTPKVEVVMTQTHLRKFLQTSRSYIKK